MRSIYAFGFNWNRTDRSQKIKKIRQTKKAEQAQKPVPTARARKGKIMFGDYEMAVKIILN
jgi:hypothetical protein